MLGVLKRARTDCGFWSSDKATTSVKSDVYRAVRILMYGNTIGKFTCSTNDASESQTAFTLPQATKGDIKIDITMKEVLNFYKNVLGRGNASSMVTVDA